MEDVFPGNVEVKNEPFVFSFLLRIGTMQQEFFFICLSIEKLACD